MGAAPPAVASENALRGQELAIKGLWAQRLLAIHDPAGAAASVQECLTDASAVSGAPVPVLLESVMGRGAWRTIRGHALAWERFERWAAGAAAYPPTMAVLVAYAASLQKAGCGPSAIPSVRATVAWVCRRLGMPPPDTSAEPLLAVEAAAVETTGRELREAEPNHIQLLRALGVLLVRWREGGPGRARRARVAAALHGVVEPAV